IVTGAVSGEVRDWNGAPVADCRIVLYDRGAEGHSSALRVQRTDGRGAFRFAQLPAGTYELRARKDGTGTAMGPAVAVAASGETGPLAIALRATATVRGRVAVAALPAALRGRPLGITLLPESGEPARGGAKGDGAFELKDVPAGRYRAEVQAWGDP